MSKKGWLRIGIASMVVLFFVIISLVLIIKHNKDSLNSTTHFMSVGVLEQQLQQLEGGANGALGQRDLTRKRIEALSEDIKQLNALGDTSRIIEMKQEKENLLVEERANEVRYQQLYDEKIKSISVIGSQLLDLCYQNKIDARRCEDIKKSLPGDSYYISPQ
jgi:formyltetrahydrofolate synthetase